MTIPTRIQNLAEKYHAAVNLWDQEEVGDDEVLDMRKKHGECYLGAGVVVGQDTDVLLVRPVGEVWSIPYTAVEGDEQPEEAAVREVKKETGLDVRIVRVLGIYQFLAKSPNNGDFSEFDCFFLAAPTGGSLEPGKSHDVQETKFFSSRELSDLIAKKEVSPMNVLVDFTLV